MGRRQARLDAILVYLRYAMFKTRALMWTAVHVMGFIVATSLAVALLDGTQTSAIQHRAHALLLTDVAFQGKSASDFADWFASVLPRVNRAQQPIAADLTVFTPIAQASYHVSTIQVDCDNRADLLIVQDLERARLRDECVTNTVELGTALGKTFTFRFPSPTAVIDTLAANFSSTVLRDDDANVVATIPLFLDGSAAVTVVRATYAAGTASVVVKISSPGIFIIGSNIGNRHAALVACVLLMVAAVVIEAVGDSRLEFAIARSVADVLSLKLFVDVIFSCLGLAYAVMMMTLLFEWNTRSALSDPSAAFDALVSGTTFTNASLNVFAALYVLYFIRLLFHLRYWNRFMVVSNMITSAFPALVGCLISFVALLIAFAALGVVQFGHFIPDFSQFSASISFLIIVLYNGGSIDYTPYLDGSPIATPVYFLLFHYWAQLIVFNVIVGVFAAAFGAVVNAQHLSNPISWDPRDVFVDLRSMMRRVSWFRWLESRVANTSLIDGDYIQTRLAIAHSVVARLRVEAGSTQVAAEELVSGMETLPGCTPEQTRQIAEKVIAAAAKQIGNADGIDLGFKLSLRDGRDAHQMESDFWQQARIIQDLYSSVCSGPNHVVAIPMLQADARAEEEAEASIRKTSDLLRKDRNELMAAVESAKSQTDRLSRALQAGTMRAMELRESIATLRASFRDVKEVIDAADLGSRVSVTTALAGDDEQ